MIAGAVAVGGVSGWKGGRTGGGREQGNGERGSYLVNEATRTPAACATVLGAEAAGTTLDVGRFGRTGGAPDSANSKPMGGDAAGAPAVVDAAMTCAAGNVALPKGTLGLPAPATWYKAFSAGGGRAVAVDEVVAEDVVDAWGDPA